MFCTSGNDAQKFPSFCSKHMIYIGFSLPGLCFREGGEEFGQSIVCSLRELTTESSDPRNIELQRTPN